MTDDIDEPEVEVPLAEAAALPDEPYDEDDLPIEPIPEDDGTPAGGRRRAQSLRIGNAFQSPA
jgi:hypothetical protein